MRKDDRSAPALAAAKRLYGRKPDATTEEFRKVCERADKAITKLSNRAFNASYVLPFRRKSAAGTKRRRKAKKRTRRATPQPRKVAVMKAQLTASSSISGLLLDLGIVDDGAHEEANKVARRIVNEVMRIS